MKVFSKIRNAFLVVFFVSSFTFGLLFLIPGDPVDFILKEASLEEKELLRGELGLDKPFLVQYVLFLKNVVTFNLGHSIHTGEKVSLLIARQFPFTFFLSISSMFLAILFGLGFGVLSSYPKMKKYDKLFDFFPMMFFSIPVFVSAPLLIFLFAGVLKWLPVSGAGSLSSLVLPSLSLALPLGAILMKMTRASVFEVLEEDFVRTAKAKGLSLFLIYYRHVLKSALIPIITIIGLQMGALLTGTVIVEVVFDRPGIGSLLFSSIVSRDYTVVQALILFIALIYIFINRFTDYLYTVLNPMMRKGEI